MPNTQHRFIISKDFTNAIKGARDSIFTRLDLQNAFRQLHLHPDMEHHCNFNIVSSNTSATYRFKTGFYGLTDMPVEFQKAIDCNLAGFINTLFFLKDILIVSRRKLKIIHNSQIYESNL